jgi:hypothetical protein
VTTVVGLIILAVVAVVLLIIAVFWAAWAPADRIAVDLLALDARTACRDPSRAGQGLGRLLR